MSNNDQAFSLKRQRKRRSTSKNSLTPLAALGGWSNSPNPTFLDLRKARGLRAAVYRLLDLSPWRITETKRQINTRLWDDILDDFGGVKHITCGYRNLLFPVDPLLQVVEFPYEKISGNFALDLQRRTRGRLLACVLHQCANQVTVLFWKRKATEITGRILAAGPDTPLPLLIEEYWERAPPRRSTPHVHPPKEPNSSSEEAKDDPRHYRNELHRLLAEIVELRAQLSNQQQCLPKVDAIEALGLDDARLKAMLLLLHPDHHDNSAAATEATKWVNNLRDVLAMKKL